MSKMSSRKGELRELGSLIGNLRLPATVKEHLKNHELWSKWSEIVGPELYRVTSPLEIRAQILVVIVAHQAWAQQLHFLRPSIVGKIRSICPDSKVKDLEFRVGEVRHSVAALSASSETETQPAFVQLSERQEMTLRAVEDPQLRESIRKAMEAEIKKFG